ncbi:MAG TPA: SidA/IucD/PvdA family monooxygenase [Streptosporangiaceae bacterium]|nr:SidA/IucD/PvdA family monooxygenase [Streptosporangiaceae bacterium]
MSSLLVAGAGPKGIAIAAKAAALAAAGLPAPEVTVVDPLGVAGHWHGRDGYTDGRRQLGTRPEKDIGFPYLPSWGEQSAEVSARMQALSWHGYLMATQQMGEWVDRSCPRPSHARWADYITWAAETAGVTVRRARIGSVDCTGHSWLADVSGDVIEAEGLVFTGPGDALRLPGQPAGHPRVLDGRTFWQHAAGLPEQKIQTACVIGGGETAGAITAALLEVLDPSAQIELVSTEGVLFTRGESFTESHMYTDPAAWLQLPERQRRAFIRRTDRGVFSVGVQSVLDQADRVHTVLGRVRRVHPVDDAAEVEIDEGHETHRVRYDLVVTAIGFDAMWWLPLFTKAAHAAVAEAVGTSGRVEARDVERSIGFNLSVENLVPALHLPVLAGPAQGPGFPNLSCLGLLADRVLLPYHARQVEPQQECRTAEG